MPGSKTGWQIIIYDANPNSLDVKLFNILKKLGLRKGSVRTKLGIENGYESKKGRIIVRWTYYAILKNLFYKNGVVFQERRAGQFTKSFIFILTMQFYVF